MSFVPTSIRVLRYPAQPSNKTHPRCPAESECSEYLETIKVDNITPSTVAESKIPFYETSLPVHQGTMVYRVEKCQFQPKISLQPDTRPYWSRKAWEDRAVVGNDRYHVLFTTSSDSSLEENRHVNGQVRGDIFVLQLSDKDKKGPRCYVDMALGEWNSEKGKWEDLVKSVEKFQESRKGLMARQSIKG